LIFRALLRWGAGKIRPDFDGQMPVEIGLVASCFGSRWCNLLFPFAFSLAWATCRAFLFQAEVQASILIWRS